MFHKPLYEALIAVGYEVTDAENQAHIPNAELVVELIRAQSQTNDMLAQIVEALKQGEAQRERIETRVREEIKHTHIRLDQVEDRAINLEEKVSGMEFIIKEIRDDQRGILALLKEFKS